MLGAYFAQALLAEGHQVRILHRRNGPPTHLGDWAARVEWIEADLLDVTAVNQALLGCQAVVHTAGMVSFNPRHNAQMWEANVTATELLVDLAMDHPITRFVHLSSVAALGKGKPGEVLDEKSPWEESLAGSAYGRSKHYGERAVWRGIAEGLPAVILNPSVVLAPGPEVRSSLQLFHYVHRGVPFYTPGELNYVDIRDLTTLLLAALTEPWEGHRFIVSADRVSYQDFFCAVAAAMEKKAPKYQLPLWLLQSLAPLEKGRTRLLGGNPLVTPDMVASLKQPTHYNTQKSVTKGGLRYRPLEESISWVVKALAGTSGWQK